MTSRASPWIGFLALGLGGCAVGPHFTRPAAPPAARYTGDTLHGEDASASDNMQHIALGREIEGNWWTLFRSDAIDQLVKQAVAHNRSLAASTATLKQAQELASAQAGCRYPPEGPPARGRRPQDRAEGFGGVGEKHPVTHLSAGATLPH